MKTPAPYGLFASGLIPFGPLEKRGSAIKDYILKPRVARLNAYQEKIRSFLASLGESQSAQIQWTKNSDYRQELSRYFSATEKSTHPEIKRKRRERFDSYSFAVNSQSTSTHK